MSRELLKRALDFLTDADYEVGINWDRDKYVTLINNIESYLAQPEDQSARVASLTERLLRDEVTRLEQQLAAMTSPTCKPESR